MACKSNQSCKKRELVLSANAVFKDARKAKEWLKTPNNALEKVAPIDAISDNRFKKTQIYSALNTAKKGL